MTHSQDVNISDNNYNLSSCMKGLSFNFVLKFFAVSTIKSFMRSPSCSWGHHLGVIPVSITQWRAEIGIFLTTFSRVSKSRSALLICNYCTIAFYAVCCMTSTLFICGDVESNPGPKNTKSPYNVSLYHWNLNSLPAQDLSNLSLIEIYEMIHGLT